jgi:hypothetical protein
MLAFTRSPSVSIAIGAALAACLAGCAPAATTSAPAVVFPTRTELASIPSQPARVEAFGTTDIAVDAWSFDTPVPADTAAHEDRSAWGQVARELAAGHGTTTTLSAAMQCTAREIARFYADKRAMPTDSLRRFMAARCGAATSGPSPLVWGLEGSGEMPDEAVAARAREAMAPKLAALLGHGHHLLGVDAFRDAKGAYVVAVTAEDIARLEPGSLAIGADRRVVLRGAARDELDAITALVNRGDAGTAPCEADPRVKSPRFALTCELAPGDSFAWVEVLGRRKGQLLMRELLETLVHEGDGSTIAYTARHVGPPAPVTGAATFTSALVDRLNGVRSGAHLPTLVLAPKQSAENTRLAGTLVDASLADDDGVADRAAIGLMAGWEVPGLIRSGNFFLAAVGPTNDATAWLDFALERPMGRSMLLDPTVRQIAVGPAIPPGGGALGAAVTTYAMFESDDHSADATKFFQRIAAARLARGLPAPVRVQGLGEMDAELARVAKSGEAPMTALEASMSVAVARTGHGVRGWVYETSDLEHGELPRELLAPGPLEVMVGVTHHRAEGAAWGQFVVLAIRLGDQ